MYSETAKLTSQQIVERLQEFAERPEITPIVATDALIESARVQNEKLKQPEAALASVESAWNKAKANPDELQPLDVMFLDAKASILLGQGKAEAVKALITENMPVIENRHDQGAPAIVELHASRCLQRLCDAQDKLRTPGQSTDDNIGGFAVCDRGDAGIFRPAGANLDRLEKSMDV